MQGSLQERLEALKGVAQDPRHHGEGDAYEHTMLVVAAMETILMGAPVTEREKAILRLAASTHDLGKAVCTVTMINGTITSQRHAEVGALYVREMGARGELDAATAEAVAALVQDHMWSLNIAYARNKAYRRLTRRLVAAGANFSMLALLVEADNLGRVPAKRGIGTKMLQAAPADCLNGTPEEIRGFA